MTNREQALFETMYRLKEARRLLLGAATLMVAQGPGSAESGVHQAIMASVEGNDQATERLARIIYDEEGPPNPA